MLFRSMLTMKRFGITVYLQMQVTSLLKRLNQAKTPRPLLPKLPPDELKIYIQQHLTQRERFYIDSHLVVKGESLDMEALVKAVKNYNT